ncbi:MAG: hypothetical protein AB7N65_18860, partial [Vicinamibacterales bacterium]
MSVRIGAHVAVLLAVVAGLAPVASADTPSASPTIAVETPGQPAAAESPAAYWSRPLPMHPKAVHIPMALCVLMPLIAAGVWLAVRRGMLTPRAWAIVAALQVATFGGGVAALLSGQDDGAKVEGYASDEALTTHENRAQIFLYAAGSNASVCTTA